MAHIGDMIGSATSSPDLRPSFWGRVLASPSTWGRIRLCLFMFPGGSSWLLVG